MGTACINRVAHNFACTVTTNVKSGCKSAIHYANKVRSDNDATQDLVKLSCHLINGIGVSIGRPITPTFFTFLKTVENFYDTGSLIPTLNEIANGKMPSNSPGMWRERFFAVGGIGSLFCFLHDVNIIDLAKISESIGKLGVFGVAGAALEKAHLGFISDAIRNTPLFDMIGNFSLGCYVGGYIFNTIDLGEKIVQKREHVDGKNPAAFAKSIIAGVIKKENRGTGISFVGSMLKTSYFALILLGVAGPGMIVLGALAVGTTLTSFLYKEHVHRHHQPLMATAPTA